LQPSAEAAKGSQDVGLSEGQKKAGIGHLDFLDAILAIHVCIVVGYFLNEIVADLGLRLPLFVTCLFAGILITNLVPDGLPSLTGTRWPTRTPAMALIADIALGTFLAMSLMSVQLWTLIDSAHGLTHPGRTTWAGLGLAAVATAARPESGSGRSPATTPTPPSPGRRALPRPARPTPRDTHPGRRLPLALGAGTVAVFLFEQGRGAPYEAAQTMAVKAADCVRIQTRCTGAC
jgi:hypothetical protein